MTTDITLTKSTDFSTYFDVERFNHAQRVATLLAASTIIPPHFQGNMANCFVALQMATRMKIEPLTFMQKSFVVNNKPGTEAQIGIGALNSSGLIKGRIKYELSGEGQSRQCIASVIDSESGSPYSYMLILSDALKVGNASRNPNWQSIPDLMLCYRAATYLIRIYYPDVLMGLSTKEEVDDMIDITPKVSVSSAANRLNDEFLKKEPAQDHDPETGEVTEVVISKTETTDEPPVDETPLVPLTEIDVIGRTTERLKFCAKNMVRHLKSATDSEVREAMIATDPDLLKELSNKGLSRSHGDKIRKALGGAA